MEFINIGSKTTKTGDKNIYPVKMTEAKYGKFLRLTGIQPCNTRTDEGKNIAYTVYLCSLIPSNFDDLIPQVKETHKDKDGNETEVAYLLDAEGNKIPILDAEGKETGQFAKILDPVEFSEMFF